MPERIPKYVNTHPFIVQCVILIVVVVGFAIGFIEKTQNDEDILESQVAACVRGNELRQTLIENLETDKARTLATPKEFFPDIPPKQFDSLIQQAANQLDEQIEVLAPVDCLEAYPAAEDLDNIDELLSSNP